jgi:hypothetical protein
MDMDNQFLANDPDGEFIEIYIDKPDNTIPIQSEVGEPKKPPLDKALDKVHNGHPIQGKVGETKKPPVDQNPKKGQNGHPAQGKGREIEKDQNWQDRLLPIMSGILIILTIYFFVTTFIQIKNLHSMILQMPSIDLDENAGEHLIATDTGFQDKLEARQLEIRSKMELFIVTNRYHQANVLLMAGLWTRYLGFVTGMVLAFVGAAFILGKLRDPSERLELSVAKNILVKIATTSPGLILVVLGFVLIFVTLITKDTYEVKDANIYLSGSNLVESTSATESIPSFIGTLVPSDSFPISTPGVP